MKYCKSLTAVLVTWLFVLGSICPADPPTTALTPVTLSGNQSIAGTKNFTGTLQLNGITLAVPASGNLVGTTDAQTLTSKTIALGSNTITYTPAGGSTLNINSAILRLSRAPQDWGAIADGGSHPLSGVYGSLAAAQAFYSFSLANAVVTASSTSIHFAGTFESTVPLQVGYPISGTGIPTGATIASIVDPTHFTISAAATASGTVTVTSSFVTSLTQQLDWAGLQMAVTVYGSINLCAGNYNIAGDPVRTINTTILGGQGNILGDGLTITGAGPQVTTITSTGDAFHILGRYQSLNSLSLFGPGSVITPTTTTAVGVSLGEGVYANIFHLHQVNILNYGIGLNNPSGWDGSSIEDCYFLDNFLQIQTDSNQNVMQVTNTSLSNTSSTDDGTFAVTGCATTTGSAQITCTSTADIFVGATVRDTSSDTIIPGPSTSGSSSRSFVVSVDDATHFSIGNREQPGAQTALQTLSGLTLRVSTIGIAVRGSGSVRWSGDSVSGGNGVSMTGSNLSAEGVHFEGAHLIYIIATSNGFVNLDDGVLFQDDNSDYLHVSLSTGHAYIARSSVSNPGITGSNGLVYCLARGNQAYPGVVSPDHTAIENWNNTDLLVVCGDYYIQGGDNAMPAPSAANRGNRYMQGHYFFYSGPDAYYRVVQIGSSYYLRRDDGLISDVNGNVMTNVTTGTTGAQTINLLAGSVNFAASASSLVVTDSLVTASSNIQATVVTHDGTMTSVQAVPTSGSFTLYANAAATAETRVTFRVVNP